MEQVVFCTWRDIVVDNRDGNAKPDDFPRQLSHLAIFSKKTPIKGFMAWDGFALFDPNLHIASLCLSYMEKIQSEASCGQCFPCRVGTRILAEKIRKICDGQGTMEDLEAIKALGKDIHVTSKCTVGKTAPMPILKSLELLGDEWEDLIKNPRKLEPMDRVVTKVTAPCTDACPAHLDIPTYLEHARNQRYADSLKVIRQDNVLPGTCGRVCVRPCEFHCRRALVDEPLQIKYIKRFISDWEVNHCLAFPDKPVPLTRGPVAIIGAGPAGLACAWNLVRRGVKVSVYEALPRPGGMAAVGIPDYRLPPESLGYEIDRIEKMGAEFHFNTKAGKDVILKDLLDQGFKAIFIGTGAHDSRLMRIEGEEAGYDGYVHGVHFLRDVALGNPTVTGKKIIVVGGGNVAIDCVRSALRIGFTDVNLVYRRSREEMPADEVEIIDALEEGIKFHFLTNPTKLIADERGKLTGVELIRMELGEPDASGRRRPVPMEGSEYVMEADCVIPAIGQSSDMSFVTEDLGVQMSRWNTVDGDEITGQSNVPNIFSGGDCFTGPASLIAALAAGNRSAKAIDQYLAGEPVGPSDEELLEHILHKIKVFDPEEKVPVPAGYERQGFSHLPVEDRITHFGEVEQVMTPKKVLDEAFRCLRCYRLALLAI